MDESTPKTRKSNLGDCDPELVLYYNDAVLGIELLFEAACSGHPGARESLRALADQINRRAGDWRRMKYIKVK